MKYAIIAAIVALAFIVIYSRLRPYLKLIRKIVTSLDVSTNVGTATGSTSRGQVENKLLRCSGCGAWIPSDRALNLRKGMATYCSTECLETISASKDRKIAG